jgi:hypothetical protein
VTATPIPADVINLAREWPSVAASLNRSVPLGTLRAVSAELESRLVIGIAMGVHSGGTDVLGRGLVSLPVFNTLLYTFLPTAQPHHIYRYVRTRSCGSTVCSEKRAQVVAERVAAGPTHLLAFCHPPNLAPMPAALILPCYCSHGSLQVLPRL